MIFITNLVSQDKHVTRHRYSTYIDAFAYVKRSKNRQKVVRIIAKSRITPSDITETMDVRFSLVSRVLRELKDHDIVMCLNENEKTGNSTNYSIPYILNFSIQNIKPETFVHAMDEYDIFLSTKSACSNQNTMSDSVYAVVKDRDRAMHSIRISLSYLTTMDEIDEFLKVFSHIYQKMVL